MLYNGVIQNMGIINKIVGGIIAVFGFVGAIYGAVGYLGLITLPIVGSWWFGIGGLIVTAIGLLVAYGGFKLATYKKVE